MDVRGLVEMRGEFLLMCLVHNVKKIVKKVLQGTLTSFRRYSNLIGEAMWRTDRGSITIGHGSRVKSISEVDKSSLKGADVFKGITV